MDKQSLADFLLPERQIHEARKRYGWVYRPGAERAQTSVGEGRVTTGATGTGDFGQTATRVERTVAQADVVGTPVAQSSIVDQTSAGGEQTPSIPTYVPPSRRSGLRRASGASPASTDAPASGSRGGVEGAPANVAAASSLNGGVGPEVTNYSTRQSGAGNGRAVSGNDGLASRFEGVRNGVGRSFVGQEGYLDELCLAFKRPFVSPVGPRMPLNAILVLGADGTGRHESVRLCAKEMRRAGITQSDGIATLELSRYATAQDDKNFLSDVYSALSSQAPILLFENVLDASPTAVKAIGDLVGAGVYQLGSRYVMQDGMLVDSAGTLARDTFDEISSAGKYLVFVSGGSEADVADVYGRRFMNALGDVLHVGAYSASDAREYAARAIDGAVADIRGAIGINLSPDGTVLDYVVAKRGAEDGFRAINRFLGETLYRTLSNYKLANGSCPARAALSMAGDSPTLSLDDQTIDLTAFMPQEYKGNLDEVKAELDEIIGLKDVKRYVLGIEGNLEAQKMRRDAGRKASPVSMHMVFTGNPGTGKTTIARVVAKYLKALGVLSSGHLREVSRSDLVGQYAGHTATQTRNVIDSAIGGVLFIDEAYSLCRGENDAFGLEAIDTLVKGMEDNRDDLVVILAGYTDEMGEFLNSNPGLRSRFPNTIEFPDYSPDEMLEISKAIAKSAGYTIAADCEEGLLRLFERGNVKGRSDSGNGRLARNVVEAAIVRQSQRILADREADMDELSAADFALDGEEEFDLEAELAGIVGLETVKEFLRSQRRLLVADQKRRDAGYDVDTAQSLNMLFLGNPGTGKTTVARIVAKMLKEMGYLKSGQLVEAGRSDLVSQYAGGTAKKTEDVFRRALGGVLFVDEAYSLSQNGDSFGQEAIDTLVKLIEDYREDTVVILAGYRREMTEFLKSNSGLESRFPIKVNFPDYSSQELVSIAEGMIAARGFALTDSARDVLPERLATFKKFESGPSGNGRMVRNFVEGVLRNQSARIAANDVAGEELVAVIPEDLSQGKGSDGFDLEAELSKIIGLDSVKQYVRSLQARLRLVAERRRLGLPTDETQTLHMVFTGNPGTGKTTMARTVAKTLYNLGVTSSDKVVETDRAGLVAGYVGQTAIKTTDVFRQALGGVLFIDEAYALSGGGQNDFGKEAIDTLVKLVDDNRDNVVVILAGYTRDMDEFLSTNPGLKSRFPNVIEFPDYSTDELLEIAELFYGRNGYVLTDDAKAKLARIFSAARTRDSFGNGRYVRNVYERSLNRQAMRLSSGRELTREEVTTIEGVDIEEVR